MRFALTACVIVLLEHSVFSSKKIGPRHAVSRGYVWPKAWKEQKTNDIFNVKPEIFEYKVSGYNCSKVQLAIQRCKDDVHSLEKKIAEEFVQQDFAYLEELQINLSEECEEFPHSDMDESYILKVSSKSELNSSSVWGILRGMETFSQLFYLDRPSKSASIQIQGTYIVDKPNYPHRGVMLDTGRHYLSLKNILKTLDAMAMNKMNVFHWHIADDESFPYNSTKLPELSKAAFHPILTYTKRDFEVVRDHAADLGIRVLMEINVPGHAGSWAASHLEIFTECKDDGIYSCPLNPTKNETFLLLKDLFEEVQSVFPDKFFHIGGNDVKAEYYLENQEVIKFMEKHKITNKKDVHALFFKNLFPLLRNGSLPVVWEEVFESGVSLPEETLVQVKNGGDGTDAMASILRAGHRGVQSAPYNLGITGPSRGYEIKWFYKLDPRRAVQNKLGNDALLKNLVGGTACVWGEMVDDNNVESVVWPRASGIAEVLWSETDGEGPDEATLRRVEEHLCRMTRRGVLAGPASGPGSCRAGIHYTHHNMYSHSTVRHMLGLTSFIWVLVPLLFF